MVLSKRLKALADLVSPCEKLADIGCDHGYLSIDLIRSGKAGYAYASDINAGPLARAKEHILEAHLQDRIETIQCDGMQGIFADTVIIAGMGGKLMHRILTDAPAEREHAKELILQPQSDLAWFRENLSGLGLMIVAEDLVYEDDKYYPMMKVIKGTEQMSHLQALYGPFLLRNSHPLLEQFLKEQEAHLLLLTDTLKEQNTKKSKERLSEIEEAILLNREAQRSMKEQ